ECDAKVCTASLPLVAIRTRYPFSSSSIFSPSSMLGVSSTQRITGFMGILQKVFGLSVGAFRWRCPRRCEPGLEGRLSVLLSTAATGGGHAFLSLSIGSYGNFVAQDLRRFGKR